MRNAVRTGMAFHGKKKPVSYFKWMNIRQTASDLLRSFDSFIERVRGDTPKLILH